MSRRFQAPPAPPRPCLDELSILHGLPAVPPTAPDVRELVIGQLEGFRMLSPTGIPYAVRDIWDWLRERRAPYQLRCKVPSWRLWTLRYVSPATCAKLSEVRRAREARGDVTPNSDRDAAALERLELIHQVPAQIIPPPSSLCLEGRR
jgi:hypothetical protein